MAIDPKHLPDDPKTLQQMVLDLMAQLDREFSERSKVESLLRELLDAKRNRSSEQLSQDQLALFASLWQARQASRETANTKAQEDSDDDDERAEDDHPVIGKAFQDFFQAEEDQRPHQGAEHRAKTANHHDNDQLT